MSTMETRGKSPFLFKPDKLALLQLLSCLLTRSSVPTKHYKLWRPEFPKQKSARTQKKSEAGEREENQPQT